MRVFFASSTRGCMIRDSHLKGWHLRLVKFQVGVSVSVYWLRVRFRVVEGRSRCSVRVVFGVVTRVGEVPGFGPIELGAALASVVFLGDQFGVEAGRS